MYTPGCIYTDELHLLAWKVDASFYKLIPKIVIWASNEEEVCHILSVVGRQKI